MLGHQNFAEQNGVFGEGAWPYDVYGESYGLLAFLPYGDLKYEQRKNPAGVQKLMELAAVYAYETTYFNLMGTLANPAIDFLPQPAAQKKVKDFFAKNPIIKAFF